MKFRKKPVVIEAFKLAQRFSWPDWFHDAVTKNEIITHGLGPYGEGEGGGVKIHYGEFTYDLDGLPNKYLTKCGRIIPAESLPDYEEETCKVCLLMAPKNPPEAPNDK